MINTTTQKAKVYKYDW